MKPRLSGPNLVGNLRSSKLGIKLLLPRYPYILGMNFMIHPLITLLFPRSYRPTNVPEVIAAKTSEFWGQLKRQPHENVDQYFNRFHDILEDLRDAEEPISDKSAIHHFIFTLGIEFKTIQNNYRIGNLPAVWTTQDWPTILTLCRDYFNSVRPQGNPRKENSTENSNFDMVAHKKKVREWFLNPHKFQKEIDALQEKHLGKCIFHLSKSHPTCDCHVKKECEKFLVSKKPNPNQTNPSTAFTLRHITEDVYEDALTEDVVDVSPVDNGTNDESLFYFTRLTNHYFRLVKTCHSRVSRHDMKYPIIADSGANHHMFRDKKFFEDITPASGTVILGDGKTTLYKGCWEYSMFYRRPYYYHPQCTLHTRIG